MEFVGANVVYAGVSPEQVERFLTLTSSLVEHLPELIASIASLVAVWRASRAQSAAVSAKQTAQIAQTKAEEAVREQINFARKRAESAIGATSAETFPTKGEAK
jgi:L-serine deaminase